jgi:hypothetical protein
LNVYVVVDWDVYSIHQVADNFAVGGTCLNAFMDLSVYSLSIGSHNFSFYAVNDYGFVSAGYNIAINVLSPATNTPAQSPTLTQLPVSSASPAAEAALYATAYPIVVSWPSSYNFNFEWQNGGSIGTSWYAGWGTILRSASLTIYSYSGQSSSVNGLSVHAEDYA